MARDSDELELSPLELVFQESFEIIEALCDAPSGEAKRKLMRKYIEASAAKDSPNCPDFEAGLEWFNTSSPLSIDTNLSGKIVVLDFFTYCCINCMHILPDLHALEQKFSVEDGVVVVGVHSAKFENEKVSKNILSAVLRYDITHPVVNDRNIALWSELMIQCWPTLLILSPRGEILFMLMGEANTDLLEPFVSEALNFYKETGDIKSHNLPIVLSKDSLRPSPLLFPGKVALDSNGRQIAIADTGHHRVLITDTAGIVQHCIGRGEPGFSDGGFNEARFNAPQGLAWSDSSVYVADTENHAIRKIDLVSKQVTTVVGTGKQGEDKEGGRQGLEQPISSPWDVIIGPSPDGQSDSVLYIAMAGTHQIWLFFLKDATWVKGRQFTKGTCIRFAGSGNEEIRNNSYPHNAAFAQPSGLTLGHIGPKAQQCLLVADSESSSIRSVNLPEGAVKGVVGATRDPKNLFAYGDVDGKAYDAKLQHPLAVAVRSTTNTLFVADSYNHKIKEVDLVSYECKTLMGSGKTGNIVGAFLNSVEFDEPGGLAVDSSGEKLYIADTNNHSIKVFHFEKQMLEEMKVVFHEARTSTQDANDASEEEDTLDSVAMPSKKDEEDSSGSIKPSVKKLPMRTIPRRANVIVLNALRCRQGSTLQLQCDLHLGSGLHLTEGAACPWSVWIDSGIGDDMHQDILDNLPEVKGTLDDLTSQPQLKLVVPEGKANQPIFLMFECTMYYCDDDGACRMKTLVFRQVLLVSEEAQCSNFPIPFTYTLQ